MASTVNRFTSFNVSDILKTQSSNGETCKTANMTRTSESEILSQREVQETLKRRTANSGSEDEELNSLSYLDNHDSSMKGTKGRLYTYVIFYINNNAYDSIRIHLILPVLRRQCEVCSRRHALQNLKL